MHPLGVDADALRARARAADVRAHIGTLGRAAGGRKLIVRVDRTELSKNIVRGLAAYRELLATRPQWRGRVMHLAFAYPSRSAVPEYRAYTERVRRLAREITEEFGTADWNPLILEVKDDYPRSLAACAVADVLVVNPIRDGMNLVAQEGPVLSERGCALVLSREAGAAATLAADALLVNPFDISETADAMHQALAMTDAERQRRSAAIAATAAAFRPARWLGDQLACLGPSPPPRQPGRTVVPGPVRQNIFRTAPAACLLLGQPPSSAAIAASSPTMPSGPSTTRSASAATCGDSGLALATAQPGTPSARSARTAAKAGRSPRSSPQNRTERAARSRTRPVSAVPLSTPGGRSSMTNRPGSAASPSRAASSARGSLSRAQRRLRVGRAAGVHGHRVRLVLDPGAVRGARLAEQVRQRGPGGLDRRRDLGRGKLAVLPPLPAVVAEHDEAGDGLEPAQADRVRRGPAGDDRDRADRLGQGGHGRHRPRLGPRVARAGHDRRQRAVEVQRDQRVPRVREQRLAGRPGPRRCPAGAAGHRRRPRAAPSRPSAGASASAGGGPAAP